MPVHETKGGYKYGETGKTYKNKKDAIKQAIAIAYSQARREGRKPTREEIMSHIKGNPDLEKTASGLLCKIAVDAKEIALRSGLGLLAAGSIYGATGLVDRDKKYRWLRALAALGIGGGAAFGDKIYNIIRAKLGEKPGVKLTPIPRAEGGKPQLTPVPTTPGGAKLEPIPTVPVP